MEKAWLQRKSGGGHGLSMLSISAYQVLGIGKLAESKSTVVLHDELHRSIASLSTYDKTTITSTQSSIRSQS